MKANEVCGAIACTILCLLAMFSGFAMAAYSTVAAVVCVVVFGLGAAWYACAPWVSLIVSGAKDSSTTTASTPATPAQED